MDLQSIKGGNAPQTQPVNTYRCGPTYGGACGPDPVPNPQTCACNVSTMRDTITNCQTMSGYDCVFNTVMGVCEPQGPC